MYPEVKPRVRESLVDDHASLPRSASEEKAAAVPPNFGGSCKTRGFRGQANTVVRYWLRQRRSYRTRAASPPRRPALRASPRQVVWLILKATPLREGPARKRCIENRLTLVGSQQLAISFFRMFRERSLDALPAWLEATRGTALASFAAGLERDIDAVREALRLPWSQGHVEGQVHRLKLIKRQMYGRAGFELLRLRVLQKG